MSHFDLIRRQARDFRREIGGADAVESAARLLELAEKKTGIRRLPVEKNDPLLCGAAAVFDEDRIYFDKTLPKNYAFYCQAHEFAHFRLHDCSMHCVVEEINYAVAETDGFDAETRVLGYGQSARTEREANCFAAEFLLPAAIARRAFVEEKQTAAALARRTGLPAGLVYSQLAQSLIEIESEASRAEGLEHIAAAGKAPTADPTQLTASQTDVCPTLLEAAPGTGKTRTLVERIGYLLGPRAVAPENVLALTFSNKAAEEMRERVAAAVGRETATRVYMTTFHAFGLDLLRKFHEAAGLPANAPVIDRIAAVELLEERLGSLELRHFQSLREPLENLPAILGTISRAKDELVAAADFERLAAAELARAATADEREKAEKCAETARVYRIYEELLRARGLLDYGDLIFRAVRLLRADAAICARLGEEFAHLLVDEYQDVNRASAELLRLAAAGGGDVWAVGDARQAIYRWRGAAATRNVRDFASDFGAPQNLYLGKNYRSRPRIVAAVGAFARELDAGAAAEGFTEWAAHRADEAGEIRFATTEDADEETAWMAAQMRELRARGTPWRGQAVIARTHRILQKVAARLEARNVPILYLGNWLESTVVRDLCAWLSLLAGDAHALVRVAAFDACRISAADVERAIAEAVERSEGIVETLERLAAGPAVDAPTRAALARLCAELAAAPADSAVWKLLAHFLFESGAAPAVFDARRPASERLALYQFLQLAQSFDAKNAAGRSNRRTAVREFLRYLRRLKIFGEEQFLQQLPASLEATDAVRLLTIHASKGLEFEAVFVPYLGGRYYPQPAKSVKCPLPGGVTDLDAKTEHANEEKSLFFVAISRARQVLCLSRAVRYGRQPSGPSPFLKALAAHLPAAPESGVTWRSPEFGAQSAESAAPPEADGDAGGKPEFYLRELEDYRSCPRRYFYRTRLKREKTDDAVYLEFHRAVRRALSFGVEQKMAGRAPSAAALRAAFAEHFAPAAPTAGEVYEREAAVVLDAAAARLAAVPDDSLKKRVFGVDLPHGRVLFAPDFLSEPAGGGVLAAQFWRLGRLRKKEADEPVYQLFHEAARAAGGEAEVRAVSLKNGEEALIPRRRGRGREIPSEEKFAALDAALGGIARREFPANPSENCPNCAYYFICPA